jgi:hypothetical protein
MRMVKSKRMRWVGHGETAPLILNLGIRRKSAVNFNSRPVYLFLKLILINNEHDTAVPRNLMAALEK